MERFGLGKEPIKPTPLEIQPPEFFEATLLVYLRVMGKLSTLDKTEDDRVLKPGQNGTNPVEGEGIPGERVVGLHSWRPGGEGEEMGAGIASRTRTYTKPFIPHRVFAVSALLPSDRSRANQDRARLFER